MRMFQLASTCAGSLPALASVAGDGGGMSMRNHGIPVSGWSDEPPSDGSAGRSSARPGVSGP